MLAAETGRRGREREEGDVDDKDRDETGAGQEQSPFEEYAEWKKGRGGPGEPPRERFRKLSHISVCMTYDLIDKLRWYEKETMKRTDAEIDERIPHMIAFLDRLRTAYLEFSEVDL
jgi:hypothetical protein